MHKLLKKLISAGLVGAMTGGLYTAGIVSNVSITSSAYREFVGASAITPHLRNIDGVAAENSDLTDLKSIIFDFEDAAEDTVEPEEAPAEEMTSIEDLIEREENFYGYEDVSAERQLMVKVAMSYKGQIPYSWGAKPTTSESYNPTKRGLDCSGFVQYCYYFVTDRLESRLGSTYSIVGAYKPIAASELKPGDLGVIKLDGSYYTVKGSSKKYYSKDEAERYVSSYNADIRARSWEDKEIEEEIWVTKRVKVNLTEAEKKQKHKEEETETSQESADTEAQTPSNEPVVSQPPVVNPTPAPTPDPTPTPAPEPPAEPAPVVTPTPDLTPDPVPDPAPDPVPDPAPTPDSEPTPDPISEPAPASEGAPMSEPEVNQFSLATTSSKESFDIDETDGKTKDYKIIKRKVKETVIKIERVSTLKESDLLTSKDISLVSNHVGIYVGLDENGRQIWCHCAGSSMGSTVVIGEYPNFNYFFKIME